MDVHNQVVNLTLSKKLKDLGVEQKSLFYWEWLDDVVYGVKFFPYAVCPLNNPPFKHYSAFTVTELTEIMANLTESRIIMARSFNCEWFCMYSEDNNTSTHDQSLANALAETLIKKLTEDKQNESVRISDTLSTIT